jgi:antibiotic biosynthesis monooxygenase (ABM) superfamily enzyme
LTFKQYAKNKEAAKKSAHMIPHPNDNDRDGPVTVIITKKAKKGKTEEFEEWMDGIVHETMKFEGHMGVNIIRPSDPSNPEYVIFFRFDTQDNLAKWEKSEARKKWLEESMDMTEGEAKVEKQTGLEFWFTPSPPNAAPPRYKMAIVVTGVIFALVSILLPQIRQATIGLPLVLSTLVGVVIMVLLMTYVIMPSVTRLLRPWLSKQKLF